MSSVTVAHATIPADRPSFGGMIRSELFRVSRMWSTWLTLVMLIGVICLPYLITASTPSRGTELKHAPLIFFNDSIPLNLFVLRVFIGFFLIVLTANVFGREYQLGTIRILLARGIGRVQLLFAKLLTVVLIALAVFVLGLLLDAVLQYIQVLALAGNADSFQKLDGTFWHTTQIYLLTILISMGVTILLTVAMTSLGRSLAFGLSASLAFFPADNIGTIFMSLGFRLTHNDFWNNATAYFLGPNLNVMPHAIVNSLESNGFNPAVPVDGTHTLLVALVYALIFATLAILLTWKRDVKE
ncbi:ABC transporter permease subunit [Tengunoibacter tsumagoiensis]|uniref:Uncharacterized protein n=1 Tax=Tengunoibacter tsumagoiensis TaxID=2014871 RepID=A0A402A3P8_9CHLR|nr:ABC transporter permease subunit [Tengunoibacter tsumagoiensis]GCE13621.1 hypothetical protein KTT_34800 [Tengunoibacter tsumagoiensis]